MATYKYELAIVCMFRDSGFYLKEWIAFHRLVGVQHFYLCNNGSTDEYLHILQPYIDAGIVELSHDPREAKSVDDFERTIHRPFFSSTIRKVRGIVHWLACIDSDEFLIPSVGTDLLSVLNQDKYKDYGGISVNWQCYGTKGIRRIAPGQLLVDKLDWKSVKDDGINRHLKVVVQPHRTLSWDIHYASFTPPYRSTTAGVPRIVPVRTSVLSLTSLNSVSTTIVVAI